MFVVGIVAWVIIGIVYVIYKRTADSTGSVILAFLTVALIATSFWALSIIAQLTDSATCALGASLVPLCLFFGWSHDSAKKGITLASIFALLLCGIAFFEMLRNPNIFTLIAGISMGIFVFCMTQKEKREKTESSGKKGGSNDNL